MKQGKIIGLRRGLYTLAEIYRRAPLTAPSLAREIFRPSYLSGLWALGYYDLIPERVVRLTSVTSRPPRCFENSYGIFDYRNIKRDGFFGYQTASFGGSSIIVAEPEKALLDHWHLSPGEWTTDRLTEMRYQSSAPISPDRLRDYAARFRSPRLDRAARRFLDLAASEDGDTVPL
jgi:predicted transcriptional regulator of viral defense system